MTGRTRHILLLLLAVIVVGAMLFALYALRGFGDLPLVGGKTEKPVVTETPAPTPEPTETPAPTPEPTKTPAPAPTSEAGTEPADEDAVSSLSGALRTGAGELRYKAEIFGSAQQGDETDSVSLGHVYANAGRLRVQFFRADGSSPQEPFLIEYASTNLHQEARSVDLNGDGSEELVLRLHTFEGEHAVILFTYDPEKDACVRVDFQDNDAITWSSDYDAATNELWHRHGTVTVCYDCYELQGTALVMTRRLADDRRKDDAERFTEYAVDGSRILTLQENVPASAIDSAKWSYVNFN